MLIASGVIAGGSDEMLAKGPGNLPPLVDVAVPVVAEPAKLLLFWQ